LFETEFLTSTVESKESYRMRISRAAQIVCDSFPVKPYSGKNASALADLLNANFLPDSGSSEEQIAETLRTVVSNSIAVSHPNTVAHLHCPPILAALASEVVISALNQSMDSFDQAPIATVVEQKMIRWLCAEAGLPSTADGTFTTGGTQSNYMGLLLARDTALLKHWNCSGGSAAANPVF
jgi:L-2,4-diaminobutyrate decarboxylase